MPSFVKVCVFANEKKNKKEKKKHTDLPLVSNVSAIQRTVCELIAFDGDGACAH